MPRLTIVFALTLAATFTAVSALAQEAAIRAYSAKDGSIIWTFDTNLTFETVNTVKANGGSLIGPGPVVVGGMVYVASGYGSHNGRGGNGVLAFGVE